MLGQWLPTFTKIKHRLTTSTTAPKTSANFIKLHYSYIIAWTLLSSVILYGNGRIPYVDALFFASGAATQSGLNTIDVNKLALYQQVVIMLVACVCNPIFIHTSVVFVRLYWFEKRFQDVVRGSQMKGRRTQSPPKRKWKSMEDVEGGMVNRSRGVGNREIRVLRGSSGHAYGGYIENEFAFNDGQDRTGDGIRVRRHSNLEEPDRTSFGPTAARHEAATDETVAEAKNPSMPAQPQDGLPASLDPPVPCLPQASHETSIAFTGVQRNPSAKGTLRIPGPRDFDLGHIPEKVEDGDGYSRKATKMLSYDSDLSRYPSTSVPTDEKDDEAHSLKHHREELGGIEYRALKLLAIILVCFFVGFHLFGMVCLTPWINGTAQYRAVVQNVGISPTWWGFFTAASFKTNWLLFWILVLLNGIDLMFFIVLDLNDPTVTSLPPGFQFLAGLFQAASTRTAGFSVVNLPELHPAVQNTSIDHDDLADDKTALFEYVTAQRKPRRGMRETSKKPADLGLAAREPGVTRSACRICSSYLAHSPPESLLSPSPGPVPCVAKG
ncbi:low affinity potassium transporter [Didymella heteroderae]|uniref:Low affinity potassium transporter n=1 Tax=Didymella heteroderae TaxID=1769908 RepID=A0A9P4WK69_9PLEO|nr:low affinity potassium transporter [Didymella heteroderae]